MLRLSLTSTLHGLAIGSVLFLGCGIAASAQTPVVVELFTSEGCSSCPPADRVLAALADPTHAYRGWAGAEVILLGEHVDYWDDLGWKDPYSSPLFSSRQQAYGRAFQIGSVYTPQAVINGEAEVLGSDRRAVNAAIRKSARDSSDHVEVELTHLHVDNFSIRVGGLPGDSHPADLLLAITESELSNNVTAGENKGRRLSHVAVVRSLSKLAELKPSDGGYVAEARLNLRPEWRRYNLKVVLLVQDRETRRILGAASASL